MVIVPHETAFASAIDTVNVGVLGCVTVGVLVVVLVPLFDLACPCPLEETPDEEELVELEDDDVDELVDELVPFFPAPSFPRVPPTFLPISVHETSAG